MTETSDQTGEAPAKLAPVPGPLRLLGAEGVVCEGDSCLVAPADSVQS